MNSRANAGMLHKMHAMDHGKPDMEIYDFGKDRRIPSMVLYGFLRFL